MLSDDYNNAIKNYRDKSDPEFKPNVKSQIDFLQNKVK